MKKIIFSILILPLVLCGFAYYDNAQAPQHICYADEDPAEDGDGDGGESEPGPPSGDDGPEPAGDGPGGANPTNGGGRRIGTPANKQTEDPQAVNARAPFFPGQTGYDDLGDYISGFYTFSIWLVTIVSVIMIIWGGYIIITSSGNPESVKKGREIITSALVSLGLLIMATLILGIINPQIIKNPWVEVVPTQGNKGGQTLTGSTGNEGDSGDGNDSGAGDTGDSEVSGDSSETSEEDNGDILPAPTPPRPPGNPSDRNPTNSGN